MSRFINSVKLAPTGFWLRWGARLLCMAWLGWILPIQAQPVVAAAGQVLLTVTTKPDGAHPGKTQGFDLAMLQALEQHSFETQTPWDARPVRFEGPLLRDALAQARVRGREVLAVARNDYTVTIPWSDIERYPVVLALKMNGQPIPMRTKGPVFLIYPFSQMPEAEWTQARERSIWQLQRLDVR